MPELMEDMSIAFPHLGIYLNYVPKSFSVFGFSIAMYGVIIGLGVLLAVTLVSKIASRTGQNPDDYWDLATYLVLISVAGARLYYVIFSWDMYKNDPIQILNIRNGGLAIYGGVLTGIVTLFVYTRIKKKSFLVMADTVVYGVILGQIIGRWGNFTNREAFGDYSDNLLAMRIPLNMVRSGEITTLMKSHMAEGSNYIQVHPTFLYESMWNLTILCLMLLYLKHKKFNGEIMLLYFGGYGLGRAMIETLRTDQLKIPGTVLPVSQMLAIGMLLISVIADIYVRRRIAVKNITE
ncbi:prolipoprotein diacylglyceryl transferase [Butyrivibrio sp. MC2013]|uniref:prolipoprotein diacylglyceryl transferase n=1 Tax=Butyrivibrio sp. MC2013 TaxID=1280686 RepID=UPI000427D6F9|nr:prolipoprotein diacylglyceryl transferase [Butyrivibrio sp. MC2013]